MGFKVGMTQIYDDNNNVVPVTVVSVAGNTVLRVKSAEGKDGYNAVQVGIGERKANTRDHNKLLLIRSMYHQKIHP